MDYVSTWISWFWGSKELTKVKKEKLNPSNCYNRFWLTIVNPKFDYTSCNPNTFGKWILRTNGEKVDKNWEIVKEATIKGLLGPEASVSTMLKPDEFKDDPNFVICVFTENYQDKDGVFKVLETLKTLNLELLSYHISYKTNMQTMDPSIEGPNYDGILKE